MGSEMCIRDRANSQPIETVGEIDRVTRSQNDQYRQHVVHRRKHCLLYTSDAADERSSVDLGGRRIIKKKTKTDDHSESLIKT